MDAMKRLGSVILLFALQLPADAQIDAQNSTITFYTTDTPGVAGPEILYSNGQKIGEVIEGQFIRLSVSPGTYQFALTEDAPPAEQLSVSVGGGQKIFLRVTRTAFFNGRAAEANASPRAVNPKPVEPRVDAGNTTSTSLATATAAPDTIARINALAVPGPDPRARWAEKKQSASSQGTRGILRCAFSGKLSLHATIQPGSPVVAEIPCDDPVFLIDLRLGSTHVRTQEGKDGFILGHNLGQWSIQTDLPERATAAVARSSWPSSTTTPPSVQPESERRTTEPVSLSAPPAVSSSPKLISPAAAPAPPADVTSPYPSGHAPALDIPAPLSVPAPDLIVPPAPVPAAPPVAILPASLAAGALVYLSAVSAPAPPEPISTSASAPTADVISASGPATDAAANADYLIGPEDVLTVTVWGEPSLSTKALVRSDGKIGMPLLGDVQAGGLTTSQLREYLQDNLTKYLRTPVVSVIVTESHSKMVHVIGSVAKPGAYSLNRPLTVMQLLGLAGGFADFAKQENVIIMRYEGNTVSRILFNYKTFVSGKNLEQNILLQNRDTIIVP